MTDERTHEADFERQVIAMLQRRAADIPEPTDASGVATIAPRPVGAGRRFVPWGIAAAVALFAGVLSVIAWPNQAAEEQVAVVAEPVTAAAPSASANEEAPVAAMPPLLRESEPVEEAKSESFVAEPVVGASPAEFFDRNGNSLGSAYVNEFASGQRIVLDPTRTDLVDMTQNQFDFDLPFRSEQESLQDALAFDGLKVQTTIDPIAQAFAERALAETMPADDRNFQMTLVAMDPATGEIVAAAGSPAGPTATVARPMGSAFQMFVLGEAMASFDVQADDVVSGIGPCDAVAEDGTIRQVENFGNSVGAAGSVQQQLARSSRCAFVELLQLGEDVTDFAPYAAMRLPDRGCCRTNTALSSPYEDLTTGPRFSVVDVALATTMFATGGLQPSATLVTEIHDPQGEALWNAPAVAVDRVMSEDAACAASSVLAANVRTGTGTRAQLVDQPVAGKTGTLDTFTDAWFIGYSPHLVTVVWMGTGNPEQSVPMTLVDGVLNVTGGSYPAEAFALFNEAWHAEKPVIPFASCPADPASPPTGALPSSQAAPACPPGFSNAVDTDDDGVPDVCYRDE